MSRANGSGKKENGTVAAICHRIVVSGRQGSYCVIKAMVVNKEEAGPQYRMLFASVIDKYSDRWTERILNDAGNAAS